jgi:phosphoketolase
MHQLMAATLDGIVHDIQRIKSDARRDGGRTRPSGQ